MWRPNPCSQVRKFNIAVMSALFKHINQNPQTNSQKLFYDYGQPGLKANMKD